MYRLLRVVEFLLVVPAALLLIRFVRATRSRKIDLTRVEVLVAVFLALLVFISIALVETSSAGAQQFWQAMGILGLLGSSVFLYHLSNRFNRSAS